MDWIEIKRNTDLKWVDLELKQKLSHSNKKNLDQIQNFVKIG